MSHECLQAAEGLTLSPKTLAEVVALRWSGSAPGDIPGERRKRAAETQTERASTKYKGPGA